MRLKVLVIACCFYTIASSQSPVDTVETVRIGGIEQFITISGSSRTKPILLFLHGGPGSSAMSYAQKFTGKLQEHFIIVQWDQRETGKTLQLNRSPRPLSLALFESDVQELVTFLLRKFNHQKLYLVGHSWGTVLGFYIAKNYPELLYAYIPICPMINQQESDRMALNIARANATQIKDQGQLEALSTISIPFGNGDQLYLHRKAILSYTKSKVNLSKSSVLSWADTWLSVYNEASKSNLPESLAEIKCPVYFMVGRNDLQTNTTITEAYYQQLTAPKKQLFWFEHAGHFIPSKEPHRMQKLIIERIMPETYFPTQQNTAQSVTH